MKKASWILFLVGIIGAVILGLLEGSNLWMNVPEWIGVLFVLVGISIGVLNITNKESVPFMISVLVIAGGAIALAVIPVIGDLIQTIFGRIAQVAIPAGITVALITLYHKSK